MTQPTATANAPLIPQAPAKQPKWYRNPFAWYLLLSPPEALNFATIFTMLHFCVDILFMVPVRFIIFPLAAAFGLIKAGSLWFRFKTTYDNNKKKCYSSDADERRRAREATWIDFLQASWETINSLGTTGAVLAGIVGFFTGAVVAMGISITFTTLLSMSAAICLAYTCYFGINASLIKQRWKTLPLDEKIKGNPLNQEYLDALRIEQQWDALPEHEKTKENPLYQAHREAFRIKQQWHALSDDKKAEGHPLYQEYQEKHNLFLINLRWFGIVTLLTVGCGLAFIGALTLPGWIIGGTGCLLAATYSAYTFYQLFVKDKKENPPQKKADVTDTTATILQATEAQHPAKQQKLFPIQTNKPSQETTVNNTHSGSELANALKFTEKEESATPRRAGVKR